MKTKTTLSIWGLGLSLLFMTGMTSCKKENEEVPQFKELTAAGEVSGTWDGNSIVTITEDVVVPEGQTLTIKAGAKIIFDGDNLGSATAPEFQVRGKLYILGDAGNMVTFTVPTDKQTEANRYLGLWGGIQCAATCDELAIKYARIEYAGAPAGPSSVFVEQGEDEGDPRYGIFFGNVDGKFALHHSEILNMSDDGMRVIGGKVSICHNFMAYIGETGGEAINLKSGVEGDMAYNVFYNLATNGTKWSNSGSRSPQTDCNSYNNTFVNCGWRRNKEGRGASVNIEKGARGNSYNNLMVNCKYGVRVVGGDDAADGNDNDDDDSEPGMDWYFFGCGNSSGSHRQCLQDFTALSGPIPLPPRATIGVWWSKYESFSAQSIQQLVLSGFYNYSLPLDVLQMDVGWHTNNSASKKECNGYVPMLGVFCRLRLDIVLVLLCH